MTERAHADEWLVEALRRGEEGAVEALVDRYAGTRRLLKDPRDAEELTQDVLLTVVQKIQTSKGEAAFSRWLYRIAANAASEGPSEMTRLIGRGCKRHKAFSLPVLIGRAA